MLRYEIGAGLPDVWEERLTTGVCADPRFFVAVATDDSHYVHDGSAIVDAHRVGPKGGVPAAVRT